MNGLDQVWVLLLWLWGELLSLGVAIRDAIVPHLQVFTLVVVGAFLVVTLGLLVRYAWAPRAFKLLRGGSGRLWGLAVRLLRLAGLTIFSIVVFATAYALVCLTIFFFLLGVLGLQQRNWAAYALVALLTAYAVFGWKQLKKIVERIAPSSDPTVTVEESEWLGWLGLG